MSEKTPIRIAVIGAEAAGVPFYIGPAQMMDEVKPEGVIIATPQRPAPLRCP